MSDRYAGSFFLSLLLHLTLAALLLVIAFVLNPRDPKDEQLFEVVQGPGEDYNATEAAAAPPVDPAFAMDLPEPLPEPPVIIPDPVVTPEPVVPPEPVPEPPKPVPQPKPTPTPPPPKPQPTPPKPRPTMTKEEFDRLHGKNITAAQRPAPKPAPVKPKLVDPRALRDGLTPTVGAGGDALSAQLQSQMNAYFARLIALLKKQHQKPPGLSDQLEATFSYHVAANGRVSQVRLVRSSGNKAFDDSVLAAFATLPPLGARPDGQGSTREVLFRMRDFQ